MKIDFRNAESRRDRGSAHKQAFTLVEVLVVMGIIATLAGILLPVIAESRESAVQTVSKSNLHQLATASIAYAGDNDDVLPPYRNDEIELVSFDPRVTTIGIPTDSPDPKRLVECLSPYTGHSDEIWHITADPYRYTGVPFGSLNHRYSSYIYFAVADDYHGYIWPIVTPLSRIRPPGILFTEVLGFIGKVSTGYWRRPTSFAVLDDGSILTGE